ncbi:hypothetical protein [Nocardiopsis tropica]|uniref:Uncharacterized protein n=1 Tax=Nocardiopsis tropica TaxID=109330 RepID=A0ABU7KWJ2_9ACTN|nr:hypothetical protein [Nocardiopsis umidischolae]MEE2053644.1 hypothetical protein [Nocardiopsis umidischolae]
MARPSREEPILTSAFLCAIGLLISGSDILMSQLNDESANFASWPGLTMCTVALAGLIIQRCRRGSVTRELQAAPPAEEEPPP